MTSDTQCSQLNPTFVQIINHTVPSITIHFRQMLSIGRLLAVALLYDHRRKFSRPAFCQPLPANYAITTISPAVCFYTSVTSVSPTQAPTLTSPTAAHRPLAVLLCWLMAKPAHINKYAVFYLQQGYDVLTVRVRPWQMLWPTKCIAVVEREVLPALTASVHESKIVHGFSAGGFVFGEMLKQFNRDPIKHHKLIGTIKAQIWDSVVDINGVSLGVSKAVYHKPSLAWLQRALQMYIDFHTWLFYSVSTRYYEESRDNFYNHTLKVPALFLCSKVDQISTLERIQVVAQIWEGFGIPCTFKIWEESDHVAHMKMYPEEYKSTVKSFLENVPGTGIQWSGGDSSKFRVSNQSSTINVGWSNSAPSNQSLKFELQN